MFTRFLMDLSSIFLRALEKQPFSLIFSVAGLVAMGWWNLAMEDAAQERQRQTQEQVAALTRSIQDCNEARTQLSVRVAVLETRAEVAAKRRK